MQTQLSFDHNPSTEHVSDGVVVFRAIIDTPTQKEILEKVREVIKLAPLVFPSMRGGQRFRFRMTNCGEYGWISDEKGYRYMSYNPRTGKAWPEMPEVIERLSMDAAKKVGFESFLPQSCLINFYATAEETLGLHQDNTEKNKIAPIVSFSLGDSGIFTLGGLRREDKKQDIVLESGDILVMYAEGRLRYHAFKKILPGTSRLLSKGGRINLTVRQVV